MNRREFLTLSGSGAVLLLGGGTLPLAAQEAYPNRSITLIVPFPPGGASDRNSRKVAAKMEALLGQSIVVDNRGGADGAIGASAAAKADADGYTLLTATGGTHILNALKPDLAYKPTEDFVNIVMIGQIPSAIVINKNVAGSLEELIKVAKENPGKFTYGTNSVFHYYAGELFKKRAGDLDIRHVPYVKSADTIADLLAGRIDMLIAGAQTTIGYHNTGDAVMVGVLSEERLDDYPDIPTAAEVGAPGAVARSPNMISAPRATPPEVVARIAEAGNAAVAELAAELRAEGVYPYAKTMTPEEIDAYLKSETALWAEIAAAAG